MVGNPAGADGRAGGNLIATIAQPLTPIQIAAAKVVAAQAVEVETRDLPPGLVCYGCGGTDLRVFKTRKPPGRIARIRVCQTCGRHRHTFEH